MTVVPREIEDNDYAKPFIFVGKGGWGKQGALWSIWKWWIGLIIYFIANCYFVKGKKRFLQTLYHVEKIHENAIQLYKNMICTKARSRHLINTRKRAYSKRTHRTIIHLLFSSSQWTSSGTKSGGPVITVYHQSVLGTSPRGAQARNIAKLQSDVPESRSWKRRNRGRTGERKNSQR